MNEMNTKSAEMCIFEAQVKLFTLYIDSLSMLSIEYRLRSIFPAKTLIYLFGVLCLIDALLLYFFDSNFHQTNHDCVNMRKFNAVL